MPPTASSQRCPICGTGQREDARYPNHLCGDCVCRAVDEHGRSLTFGNVGVGGGFVASYAITGERRDSHICFVDGVTCWADEARFGGIVVQPYGEHDEFPRRSRLDAALLTEVAWGATPNAFVPYVAQVSGSEWALLLGQFPEEPMYTLFIDRVGVGAFDDWPPTWSRPATPGPCALFPWADAIARSAHGA